jgi:hypothetical protein
MRLGCGQLVAFSCPCCASGVCQLENPLARNQLSWAALWVGGRGVVVARHFHCKGHNMRGMESPEHEPQCAGVAATPLLTPCTSSSTQGSSLFRPNTLLLPRGPRPDGLLFILWPSSVPRLVPVSFTHGICLLFFVALIEIYSFVFIGLLVY